jgi:hypothetical protein
MQPHTHLMAYAVNEDLSTVYLASARSRKTENMLARPDVSLLWDNRTGNLADHGDGLLVTASGKAALANKEEVDAAKKLFVGRNPNMAGFLAIDGVSMFAVKVSVVEVVEGYSRPTEWRPGIGNLVVPT